MYRLEEEEEGGLRGYPLDGSDVVGVDGSLIVSSFKSLRLLRLEEEESLPSIQKRRREL